MRLNVPQEYRGSWPWQQCGGQCCPVDPSPSTVASIPLEEVWRGQALPVWKDWVMNEEQLSTN